MSLDIYLYYEVNVPEEAEEEMFVLWDANITHNLARMAHEAGIYDAVWAAEGVECAQDIADILEPAIKDMKENAEKYREYDAKNGWGTYEQFIPWLEELLRACKQYPDSKVKSSR